MCHSFLNCVFFKYVFSLWFFHNRQLNSAKIKLHLVYRQSNKQQRDTDSNSTMNTENLAVEETDIFHRCWQNPKPELNERGY